MLELCIAVGFIVILCIYALSKDNHSPCMDCPEDKFCINCEHKVDI